MAKVEYVAWVRESDGSIGVREFVAEADTRENGMWLEDSLRRPGEEAQRIANGEFHTGQFQMRHQLIQQALDRPDSTNWEMVEAVDLRPEERECLAPVLALREFLD